MRPAAIVFGMLAMLLSGPAPVVVPATGARPADAFPYPGPASQVFEANRGQAGPQWSFIARGDGYKLLLGPRESTLRLPTRTGDGAGKSLEGVVSGVESVRLSYLGAQPARVVGAEALPGKVHYLLGSDPDAWLIDIPTFAAVRYVDLYPGVDLFVRGDLREIEYLWVVSPGADPGAIRILVEGGESLAADTPAGEWTVRSRGGELRLAAPVATQQEDGAPCPVRAETALTNGSEIGFRVWGYDAGRPLALRLGLRRLLPARGPDPDDEVRLTLDGRGGTYLAGRAVLDPGKPGDAFVSRFDGDAATPRYTTYFGGAGEDAPLGITVDPEGAVLLTGWTTSADFPARQPLPPGSAGGRDAFVVELARDGSTLVHSTTLGGEADDEGHAIAVDVAGGAWITGETRSQGFPTTAGALQVVPGGLADAFLARLTPDGSGLSYASYLGGSGADEGVALRLDGRGDVHFGGTTRSSDLPFARPLPGTPAEGAGAPSADLFVAKLDAEAHALAYAVTLGGSGEDLAAGLDVDVAGNTYLAGRTSSPDFPAGSDSLQPSPGGGATGSLDAFVAKLDPEGESLLYAAYLGGGSDDEGLGLAVDAEGNAWIAGTTRSGDLPLAHAAQARLGGSADAFVAQVGPDGKTLQFSTFLGGADVEAGSAVVVMPGGGAVVAGISRSSAFPQARWLRAAHSGGRVFLADLSGLGRPEAAGCPGTIQFDNSAGTGLWQTATNWDLDRLPGSADDVCIPAGFNVTLGSGSQSIGTLLVTSGSSLSIAGGTLSIAAASQIDGGFGLSGGSLTGAGTVTVAGAFTWTGGTMTGAGTINANAGVSFSGSGAKDLTASRVLNTAGTTTWTGAGRVGVGGGASIHNTGTWDVQNDATLALLSGAALFDNASSAIFRKSAGSLTTTINIPFDNAATLDVQSGTVNLSEGGTGSGSFTGSTGTTLQFGGGTYTLTGTSSVAVPALSVTSGTLNVNGAYAASASTSVGGGTANFNPAATMSGVGSALTVTGGILNLSSGEPIGVTTLSMSGGTLQGADTVTVSGTFTWTGGTMTGAGTTDANAGVAFSGTGPKDLTAGRVLNTAGATTWTGSGRVGVGGGSSIHNTGSWDAQSDAAIIFLSGGGLFDNTSSGVFRKTAGAGTTTITILFDNAGTLDVQSGTINLGGGGTGTGSFTGTGSSTLQFGGGTYTLAGTSSVAVPAVSVTSGTLDVNGAYAASASTSVSIGTANFNPAATVGGVGSALTVTGGILNLSSGEPIDVTTLSMSGGTLQGTDAVTVSGAFTWTGGAMTGAGTTNANAGVAFSGTGVKDLTASRVLNTAGTTTWTGTGRVGIAGGASIHNAGTWDAQSDASLQSLSGAGLFDNTSSGVFRKTAGAVTTISLPFDNAGTLEVQTGTISLSGGGMGTGAFTGSSGTALQFAGGGYTLTGTSSVTVPAVSVIVGTLDVNGAYGPSASTSVSNGTANFNPAATVSGVGSALTVTGGILNLSSGEPIGVTTLSMSGGTLQGTDTVTVSGALTWTGGTMTGAGTTNANAGVTFSGSNFKDLTASRVLNTAGATTWTGSGRVGVGGGSSIHNAGSWDAQSDAAISFLSGGGLFDNTSSGVFRKTAGAGTTTIAILFENAGTLDVQSGTISLGGGGTGAGSFTGTGSGTLQFAGGTYTLTGTSSVGVPAVSIVTGVLEVNGTYAVGASTSVGGGTANFNPAATVSGVGSALTITGGVLNLSSGEAIGVTTLSMSGGTMQGPDTLTVSGTTAWTGGTMTGPGTTNADGAVAFSGASAKDLTGGRVLNTAATTTWTGMGRVGVAGGSSIHNTGTWDAQSDASLLSLSGGGLFDNTSSGVFRKTAGAGTTTITLPFDNAGTVDLQIGTVALSGGGTATGSFTGSAGTTLRFGSLTYTLSSASSVTASTVSIVSGTLDVSGAYSAAATAVGGGAALATFNPAATVTALGALSVSSGTLDLRSGEPVGATTLSLTGGTLQGTDTLTVSGATTWNSGTMAGAGTTNASGGIAFSGLGARDLTASRVLNTAGTTTWTGTGPIRISTGASIHNTGIWDTQGDTTLELLPGGGLFDNASGGTFRKSAGPGTTNVNVPFTNAGAVQGLAGTMSFSGGYTQTAGATTLNGGTITSSTTMDLQGGSLSGAGTLTANVTSAAHVAPGLSPGSLTISGSYVQSPGGSLDVELGGLAPGTGHDQLAIGGAGTATLSGALNAVFVNGFVPAEGNTFTVLTYPSATGTFAAENLPPLPLGGFWRVTYGPTSLVLAVVLDADGDGVSNSLDCAPFDPGAFALPGDLTGGGFAADGQTFSWTSAALTSGVDTVHDVMRGALRQFPVGSGAAEICLASGLAASSTTDATFPAARNGLYYLVRGRNVCGTGTYGFATGGAERITSICP